MAMGVETKMLWRRTRDIVIETLTTVKDFKKTFNNHVETEEKQFVEFGDLVESCRDDWEENHKAGQLKLTSKADETHKEVLEIKKCVNEVKNKNRGKRELIFDSVKMVGVICVILGTLYGYSKWSNSREVKQEKKIEAMLEKLLDK